MTKLLKNNWWLLIVILVLAVDQVTKYLALNTLILEEPVKILPFLNWYFIFNTGAAFSFLNQAGGWQEWLFVSIAIGVSVFIILWQIKVKEHYGWLRIALALVLGGTLGNLHDRVFYHMVIDFIDFHFNHWHYPTFNFADIAISIGAIMLIIDILKKEKS